MRPKAFTLIEVLVALVIIAMLGMIFYSGLNRTTPNKATFQSARGSQVTVSSNDFMIVTRNNAPEKSAIASLVPGTYRFGTIKHTKESDFMELKPNETAKPIVLSYPETLDMANMIEFTVVMSGDSDYDKTLTNWKKRGKSSKP